MTTRFGSAGLRLIVSITQPIESTGGATIRRVTKRKSRGLDQLATNLKEFRRRRGLTQQQLADLSGVDRSTIGQLETRRLKDTSTATLAPLADALGVAVHDLVFDRTKTPVEPMIEQLRQSHLVQQLKPPLSESDIQFLRSQGTLTWLDRKPSLVGLLLMIEGFRASEKPGGGSGK